MPKARPDFETAAYRYLDGEMSEREKTRFLAQVKQDKKLKDELGHIKRAHKAMQAYKFILPPASVFGNMRKSLMAEI